MCWQPPLITGIGPANAVPLQHFKLTGCNHLDSFIAGKLYSSASEKVGSMLKEHSAFNVGR
jgi:hypothetical protein